MNIAPQSPPERSDDGTYRSNDSRLSVTSEDLSSETSSNEDDAAQAMGPVLNNPLADKPSTEAHENDNTSDASSRVSSDTESTNSWVNEDDEILTTTDLLDPYDWVTEPLPELTESQWEEYKFLRGKSMIPVRDEHDDIYRCLECAWEVEYGYCTHCKIWFDGIAPPDCEWRSGTPSEYSSESSEVAKHAPKNLSEHAKDATQDPEGQVDQAGTPEKLEMCSESLDSSESEIEVTETLENEADSTSCKSSKSDDKVGEWLRNIGPHLESVSDSAFKVFKATTCTSDPPDASFVHLSKAHSLDNEAITLLRLGRWDRKFFQQKVRREREQVQQTIKNLEDNLGCEKKETQRLENELSNLKEDLRTRTVEAGEYKKLQSELTANKMIVRAEWRSEELRLLHEKRKAREDN